MRYAVISVQGLFVFNVPTNNHSWGCDLLNKNLRPFHLKAPWHPITPGSLESEADHFLSFPVFPHLWNEKIEQTFIS